METFHSRDQARAVIKLYGRHYNQRRPHSSLGYQTPGKFAGDWKDRAFEMRGQRSTAGGCEAPLRKTP